VFLLHRVGAQSYGFCSSRTTSLAILIEVRNIDMGKLFQMAEVNELRLLRSGSTLSSGYIITFITLRFNTAYTGRRHPALK
jgi:hypothetical protein